MSVDSSTDTQGASLRDFLWYSLYSLWLLEPGQGTGGLAGQRIGANPPPDRLEWSENRWGTRVRIGVVAWSRNRSFDPDSRMRESGNKRENSNKNVSDQLPPDLKSSDRGDLNSPKWVRRYQKYVVLIMYTFTTNGLYYAFVLTGLQHL